MVYLFNLHFFILIFFFHFFIFFCHVIKGCMSVQFASTGISLVTLSFVIVFFCVCTSVTFIFLLFFRIPSRMLHDIRNTLDGLISFNFELNRSVSSSFTSLFAHSVAIMWLVSSLIICNFVLYICQPSV